MRLAPKNNLGLRHLNDGGGEAASDLGLKIEAGGNYCILSLLLKLRLAYSDIHFQSRT